LSLAKDIIIVAELMSHKNTFWLNDSSTSKRL